MIGFGILSTECGEVQRNTTGERLVRDKAQLLQIVVTVVAVIIIELVVAEIRTGKGGLAPLAVPGVNRTGIVKSAVRPAELHIFEAACTTAVAVKLVEIIGIEFDLLTGLHRIGDITLNRVTFTGGNDQCSGSRLIILAALSAVKGKLKGHTAREGFFRDKAQLIQIIVTVIAILIIELVAAQARAGEFLFVPLVIPEVNSAVCIIGTTGTIKHHIFEASCAAAVRIDLLEIRIIESNFSASFH